MHLIKHTSFRTVIYSVLFGIILASCFAHAPKAAAITVGGCIYDGNQQVWITPSTISGNPFTVDTCDQFMAGSPQAGAYYLIIDKRDSDTPCHNTTVDQQITKQQFDQIKTNPSSYTIQSKGNCGGAPPLTLPPASNSCSGNSDSCNILVQKYINPLITFLGIGFGIITAIMIAIGGIQYASSGGDPQMVAAAKKRITNAILALLAFALMYAFLQWLVPGGIF